LALGRNAFLARNSRLPPTRYSARRFQLTEFPQAGVARDQLVAGVRSIVVYPTVIFYRVGDASIDIVRVVDGRRNLAAFFSRDSDD
jgi:plasmid stabilization system protein ParE